MKLDIIYRCCNAEVDSPPKGIRPPFFDKLRCLQTFLASVQNAGDAVGRLMFIHDGPKGRLYDHIPKQYEILHTNLGGNQPVLMVQIQLANQLANNLLFVEDDYLHLPESVAILASAVQRYQLVTGYDHGGFYMGEYAAQVERILHRDPNASHGRESIDFHPATNRHWRTVDCTTHTFAITRDLWSEVHNDFQAFGVNDISLYKYLATVKAIKVWSPIPALMTHVDNYPAPGVDWSRL